MHLIQFPQMCEDGSHCRQCRAVGRVANQARKDARAPIQCPRGLPLHWDGKDRKKHMAAMRKDFAKPGPVDKAAPRRQPRYQASDEDYAVRLKICQSCQFAPEQRCILCKACKNAPQIENVARTRRACPAEKW